MPNPKKTATPQQQLVDCLEHLAGNQKVWRQMFGAHPADSFPKDLPALVERLCADGQPALALQTVYLARNTHPVSEALTSMFALLLAEKVRRDGVSEVQDIFLDALAQQKKKERK